MTPKRSVEVLCGVSRIQKAGTCLMEKMYVLGKLPSGMSHSVLGCALSLLVRAWTRLHPAGICMFGGSNLVLNLHEWEALTVCSLEGRAPQSSEIPIPFSPLYLHLLQSPRPQRTGITFAYFLDLHYSSYSTPVFLLGNPMDREAWRATVHGVARVRHALMAKPPSMYLS